VKLRAACRSLSAAVLLVIGWLLVPAVARAADQTDVPLKNWGGFARFRDWVYDDLERLVTSGIVGRTVLSTKPMSRTEAARIVARAIEAVRNDQTGAMNERRDLEGVLDRLAEEFRTELVELGVKYGGDARPAPRFVAFVPIDQAQVRAGYANRDLSLIDTQGLKFQRGVNAGATFDSRLQVGKFLGFYLQPELVGNEEYGSARLAQGYAKLTLFNVELTVGRESLWWGPGIHGSLILSDNAQPLDQIRIGAAEPFLLPLIGKWVGPTKVLFFIAQLEESLDHPKAKLSGLRVTASPFRFLELGFSRAVMFDGTDRPRPSFTDTMQILFNPPAGDNPNRRQFRSNNLFAIDADVRLANVDRYHLPAKDLRLYGEFGWDDTCCASNFIPLRDAISALVGIHWINLFGQEGLEARAEYAKSSKLSFTHTQFNRGYWTRGEVISHFMGTNGEDFYTRLQSRVTSDVMIGVEGNRAVIGNTRNGFRGPTEQRIGGAIDVSWKFFGQYSLFAQYGLAKVDNRDFNPRNDGVDHLVRLELTRSFR
jgi:Capsule assembly protein Wzi